MINHERTSPETANERANRIASVAAEGIVRTEGISTAPDEFAIPQCQADDHMRDCIDHLLYHGEAVSFETDDGYIIVQLGEFTPNR